MSGCVSEWVRERDSDGGDNMLRELDRRISMLLFYLLTH